MTAEAEPPPVHLFLSPSGEPFRRSPATPNPFDVWFDRADANHDGKIDRAEFRADAAAFFKRLDTNSDGVIDGFEVNAYEHDVAPELVSEVENRAFGGAQRVYRGAADGSGHSRHGGWQQDGAGSEPEPPPERGHAALLNEPEPVSGARSGPGRQGHRRRVAGCHRPPLRHPRRGPDRRPDPRRPDCQTAQAGQASEGRRAGRA